MWRMALAILLMAAQQIPRVTITSDADALAKLQLSVDDVAMLRSRGVLAAVQPQLQLPEIFSRFPIPQSVPRNAEARAGLRAKGLNERDIEIGETVGAFAAEGTGYWFGKSFYNGEGERGSGGIGFVSDRGAYAMLAEPSLRQVSVSSLLVDRDAIWAGIVNHAERGDVARGLARYDRTSKRLQTFPVPNVIHSIVRLDSRVFMGTNDGPYLLKSEMLTRLVWK